MAAGRCNHGQQDGGNDAAGALGRGDRDAAVTEGGVPSLPEGQGDRGKGVATGTTARDCPADAGRECRRIRRVTTIMQS